MHKILEEIKSYCSVRQVGRKRIEYFLYWLYKENNKEMNELAYKFGLLHSSDAFNVCRTIVNSLIEFKLLIPKNIEIDNKSVEVYSYNVPTTNLVRDYLLKEKKWIAILKLRNDLYDF